MQGRNYRRIIVIFNRNLYGQIFKDRFEKKIKLVKKNVLFSQENPGQITFIFSNIERSSRR